MAQAAVHIVDGDVARPHARRRDVHATRVPVHTVGSCSVRVAHRGSARGIVPLGDQGCASWLSGHDAGTGVDVEHANRRSNAIGERYSREE